MIRFRVAIETWPEQARKQPPFMMAFHPYSGGPVNGGALLLPWFGPRRLRFGLWLRPVLAFELEW